MPYEIVSGCHICETYTAYGNRSGIYSNNGYYVDSECMLCKVTLSGHQFKHPHEFLGKDGCDGFTEKTQLPSQQEIEKSTKWLTYTADRYDPEKDDVVTEPKDFCEGDRLTITVDHPQTGEGLTFWIEVISDPDGALDWALDGQPMTLTKHTRRHYEEVDD